MSWSYRLCRYTLDGETLFGLREVYYESDGRARGFTSASVDDWASADEIKRTLRRMLGALQRPVLTIAGLDPEPLESPERRKRKQSSRKKTVKVARKGAKKKSAKRAQRRR